MTPRFLEQLQALKMWDGSPIGPGLQNLLVREWERWKQVREQIQQIETQRKAILKGSSDPAIEQVRRLLRLKGVGLNSA